MMNNGALRQLALIVVAVLCCAAPAWAAETFNANLRPRDGVVSDASGTATLVLNNTETEITFEVHIAGLSSPELAAHIHRADGDILLQLPLGENKAGAWQNPGLLELFQLKQGQLFILVHTEDNPGGELRGDLSSSTVTLDDESIGRLKARFD